MGSPVNRKIEGVSGTSDWIPLNRWSRDNYTIVTTVASGTPTYTVQFTIDQINREGVLGNETARPVVGGSSLTTDANLNITDTPMEAIRITVSGGTVDFHVMQQGE